MLKNTIKKGKVTEIFTKNVMLGGPKLQFLGWQCGAWGVRGLFAVDGRRLFVK